MRCSVVFGITLRLLVIHISTSFLPQSTVPLTTSDVSQLAAGRWPWSTGDRVDNTWPVAALTVGSEAMYKLRIAISAYPPAFDAPVRGVPVGILPCRLFWCGKTKMVWLHDDDEKLRRHLYSF